MHTEIDWDPEKAIANYRKHGVHFEEAASALLDPQSLSMEDADSVGESRWILVGMSSAAFRRARPRGTKQLSIRKEYDFSKAKRAKDIPHLAKLQAESKGKTRITIMLDNDLLAAFRARAQSEGTGYQTLINRSLRQLAGSAPVDEATLRRVLREELKAS